MRTKTTMNYEQEAGYNKLGRRRPKRMPYEEPIGRDRIEPYGVLKNNHQEELGRKGQRNSQKKQHSGEKGALEKEHNNHEKELGNFFFKTEKKP